MGEVWAAIKGVCDWPTFLVVIALAQTIVRALLKPSGISNKWIPAICAPVSFGLGAVISLLRPEVVWWFGGWSGLFSFGFQMFLYEGTKDVWPTLIQRLKDAVAIWKRKL